MTEPTTTEIAVTMSRRKYRAQLAHAVRELASAIRNEGDDAEYDPRGELSQWVTEYVSEEGGAWLTHPVSVIEHADATVSHRGASRLGDVSSTEDFAQEHARDVFEQDIVTELEEVLNGEPVEDVVFDSPEGSDSAAASASDGESKASSDYVMITPETAECAIEELDLHLNYQDKEMDTSAARSALSELQKAVNVDTPRTRVCRVDNMEEVVIPGVKRGTLKLDYIPETPKLILHTPDDRMVEPVVGLPPEEDGNEGAEKVRTDGGDE